VALSNEAWERRYQHGDLGWTNVPHPVVIDQVGDLSPNVALDLGAGSGRHAVWLARHGWTVSAVDFSATALARAGDLARAAGVELDLVHADLADYQPCAGAFTLALVAYVHVDPEDRRRLLAGAARAVMPGGRVLVVGHDVRNLGRGVGGPDDPALMFTPERIAAELPGLLIERAETVAHVVETADEERGAFATVVRMLRPAAT
jgi:SAM-dependent methyltransferase